MIIELTQGYQTVIDDEDWPLVRGFSWSIKKTVRKSARKEHLHLCAQTANGRGGVMLMHRLLMDAPPCLVVDHIDGDSLNNRRANMRLASYAENNRNRRAITARAGFKGVVIDGNRWRAKIVVDGKAFWLGTFSSAEDAARAYDAASRTMHGRFGVTNSEMVTL